MEPLDLGGQLRFLNAGAIQQVIHRTVHLADLHDVDAVVGCRRDADELSAQIGTGTMELMALQGRDDKDLDTAAPHSGGHQLHGETLAGATGTQYGDVGVLVDAGIKDIHDDQRVVILVHAQQDAVRPLRITQVIMIRLSQARDSSTVRPEREKFIIKSATEAVTMAAMVEIVRIWV